MLRTLEVLLGDFVWMVIATRDADREFVIGGPDKAPFATDLAMADLFEVGEFVYPRLEPVVLPEGIRLTGHRPWMVWRKYFWSQAKRSQNRDEIVFVRVSDGGQELIAVIRVTTVGAAKTKKGQ